jgi:hypothetical protein
LGARAINYSVRCAQVWQFVLLLHYLLFLFSLWRGDKEEKGAYFGGATDRVHITRRPAEIWAPNYYFLCLFLSSFLSFFLARRTRREERGETLLGAQQERRAHNNKNNNAARVINNEARII